MPHKQIIVCNQVVYAINTNNATPSPRTNHAHPKGPIIFRYHKPKTILSTLKDQHIVIDSCVIIILHHTKQEYACVLYYKHNTPEDCAHTIRGVSRKIIWKTPFWPVFHSTMARNLCLVLICLTAVCSVSIAAYVEVIISIYSDNL